MLVNMLVYTNDRGPEMRWEMAVWRKIRCLATVPPKEIVNADPISPTQRQMHLVITESDRAP